MCTIETGYICLSSLTVYIFPQKQSYGAQRKKQDFSIV